MKMHEAPDPAFAARIADSFGRQGFMAHVGAKLQEVEPGRCVIGVAFRRDVAQQHGFFHGGLIGTLIDNAGAYAAFTLIDAGESMLTAEYKVNLLSPAVGQRLEAVGCVVRAGRNLSTSHVEVFAIADGRRGLCAIGLVTLMRIMGRGDS